MHLAHLPKPPPAAWIPNEGALSDVLFQQRNDSGPIATFGPSRPSARLKWTAEMDHVVDLRWELRGDDFLEELVARIENLRPNLVLAANPGLARTLIARTRAPIWAVREQHRQRAWFSMKRIHCAARGSTAIAWSWWMASRTGAELEIGTSIRGGQDDADVTVVGRGAASIFSRSLASLTARAVVVI